MIGESTPRVIKQALHHQFKPEWRGVIKKQGHRVKNWKNRYFVLSNCVMLYYRCEADYINPEKCHDPLGYHIITSISPVNDKVFAGAGGVSSSTSAVTSKMMSENYEYVVETLEEKTFYLKFSFTSGFFNAAQRAISVYLTEYREVAEPPLQLAICLSHIGYIDLSIQLLQNFVRRTDSKNVEGLYHLGTALLINNNFVDAINVLQECLDAKNDHTQAMINLATALYCTDSLDHARSLYESALRLEPSNVEAANNLTLLHAQNGTNSELELAEFKIKYAITCRNDEPQLYLTYAEVLMSVNDLDRAIDILFQGLKAVRTQDSSNLNLKLGELFFLKNQDKSEAIEYFQHAIGINPKNMKARQLLEEALIMREDAVTTQESQLLKHQHDQLKSQSTTLHAVDEHSNKQEFDSINSDIVILKGMLEKNNPEEGGEWRTQYCELSRQKLQWFLSGSEYAKMKDPSMLTHILISDIRSISKVANSSFQFDIDVAGGDTYSFRSTSEHDTNTWLDTLQIQRVYYERHMS